MVVLYYHHYSLMPWRGPHHIIKHPILLLAIFCELATSKGSTDYMKMRELRQKKLPIGDTPAVIKTLNDIESCREVPSNGEIEFLKILTGPYYKPKLRDMGEAKTSNIHLIPHSDKNADVAQIEDDLRKLIQQWILRHGY